MKRVNKLGGGAMTLDKQVSDEFRCRVDGSGRVLIPRPFRKALGISAGDEVLVRIRNEELQITTQRHRIEIAQGRARRYVPAGVSLVNELLRDRRREAQATVKDSD
jgi:AbrB family looped-hinge helix DNA binding protein